ncbi:unnamed protein product, partial [Adineta ricciae]
MPHAPSPYLRANFWSRLFHGWISHLIATNRNHGALDAVDLYELLPEYQSKKLTDDLENNWLDEKKRSPRNPSLIRATIRTMGYKPVLTGLLLIPWMLCCIVLPLFLTFLMDFFEPCSTMSVRHAWFLTFACIITPLLSSFFLNYYMYHCQLLGLQMRVAYSGLIYRKTLRLSSYSLNSFSAGSVTNLLSNDAGQIEVNLWSFNFLWKFLLLDESERDRRLLSSSTADVLNHEDQVVYEINNQKTSIQRTTSIKTRFRVECNLKRAYWEMNPSFVLKNIVFDAQPGNLICIIGSVGSGKSSLLQALTGEIAFFQGKVRLRGSFCYVPQEPWIFSSTVKKNIIFGKEYDGHLFRRVIRAAALEADFAQLPNGMHTTVGDQGVTLSGGQKARVNMARALYRDADIYLLDDPLSAVDARVSKELFERSIKEYLGDKICILVTHQIQFLQHATKIIILENGEMLENGTYEELRTSSPLFRNLVEVTHQQEENEETIDFPSRKTTRCVTFSEAEIDELRTSKLNIEKSQQGSVGCWIYASYLRAGAGLTCSLFLIVLTFGGLEAVSIYFNWWLAKWSEDQTYRHQLRINCSGTNNKLLNQIQAMNTTTWNNYQKERFTIFTGVGILRIVITLVNALVGRSICLNASRVLHNKMFRQLLRCPISFFDVNPIGRILNRFTKDVHTIDSDLPWLTHDLLYCIFQTLGIIVFVSWLNRWSLFPAGIGVALMLFLRHRFAGCSRNLKRLEHTSRSPVYSYLTSTLQGLKVIRSYRAENICLSDFHAYADDHTRASYLLTILGRWAAIRFEWIACFFIVSATILAVIVRIVGQRLSAADIALTLLYSINLTSTFQWGIRVSVEVETQMTAVERVLEYCALEQEPPAQLPPHLPSPPSNWPTYGRIIFDNVSMSHSANSYTSLALNRISLSINPAEKIGIVGRTGAG